MVQEFSFTPIKNRQNGHKPATKPIEEEIEDEFEDDEDELEEDMISPPMPSGSGGGAAGIFAGLTSGPSLVESDASVKELFSNDNLLMKTDLSGPAIPIMARLFTLANKYQAKEMQRFLWTYLKLRVSRDRNGRNDIVQLALRRQGLRDDEDF